MTDNIPDKSFIVDRNARHETKSRDVLIVHFDAAASAAHFSREWSTSSAVYRVENVSGKDGVREYTVAFFRSESGELIVATCHCVAKKICKHIIRAWDHHEQAERTGYIPQI